MFNTHLGRVLIAIAISLLFVGSTVSQPTSLASGYSAGVYSADVTGSLADDTVSSFDLIPTPLFTSLIALAALVILVGFRPRPAARTYSVSHPVLPQGPPTRH